MSALLPAATHTPPSTLIRPFAGLFIASAVVFSFWTTIGKPDCMDMDFGACYRATQAVSEGRSPYFVEEHGALGSYPYAPVFSFLLIPLGDLDYPWACRIWLLLNWLILAACCFFALRLIIDDAAQHVSWHILGIALIPIAAYAWYALRVGQVSLLMLVGCLAWAACRRTDRRLLGGLVLSAACALKLAPGVFVLYLLIRRDFRGLAGVAMGTALLFFAPALWVGPGETIQLHEEWASHIAATQTPEQTFRPGNQSLLGQLARLPAISNGYRCYSEDNLGRLCSLYRVLVLALAVVCFALMIWRRRNESLELAFLFTFVTLIQPRGWRCNFVMMLLPCLLLAKEVVTNGQHWRLAAVGLACMTLACALPTRDLDEVGWSWPTWLLLGKHFWGAAAVGAATWCCCRRQPDCLDISTCVDFGS